MLCRTKEEPFVLKAEYIKDLNEAKCSSLEMMLLFPSSLEWNLTVSADLD